MGNNDKKNSSKTDEASAIKEKVQKLNDEIKEIDETTPLTPPVFQEPATTYATLTPPVTNVRSGRARNVFSRFGGLALLLLTVLVVGALSFLVVRAARNNDDNSKSTVVIEDQNSDSATVVSNDANEITVEAGESTITDDSSSENLVVEGAGTTASDPDEDLDSSENSEGNVVAIIGDDTDSSDSSDVLGANVGNVPTTGVSELPNTGISDYAPLIVAIAFSVTFAAIHTRQLNAEDL